MLMCVNVAILFCLNKHCNIYDQHSIMMSIKYLFYTWVLLSMIYISLYGKMYTYEFFHWAVQLKDHAAFLRMHDPNTEDNYPRFVKKWS